MCERFGEDKFHLPSDEVVVIGEAEEALLGETETEGVGAGTGDAALWLLLLLALLLLGGRLPRPHMEKSKSSALYSKLCFSKYCRSSLRDRNFLPSGLNEIIH